MKTILLTVNIIIVILVSLSILGCEDSDSVQPPDEKHQTVNTDEMVFIPAGEFLMGSSESDVEKFLLQYIYRRPSRYEDEQPQHTVYLDAFYIDKYEITNAQYKKFLEATGTNHPLFWNDELYNQPDQPVMAVSWKDAEAYAKWADKRLPTEAEWEKASRGTDGRIWPWGNDWDPTKLNANDAGAVDGYVYSAPVGSYPQWASPYSVNDMAGNVFEWCADWYDKNYYKSSPKINPKGPESGENHVARGGSWDVNNDFTRCPSRFGISPGSLLTGIRCAKSVQ